MDLIEHEIVPVRGEYYIVKNIRENGTVILKHHPTHKFVSWDKKKKDLNAEDSVKRALAIPGKKIEIEDLFIDLRIHFLRLVDQILKK